MGEIKPGILALVVGSNGVSNNIGRIVEVVRRLSNGEEIPNGQIYVGQGAWLCYADGMETTYACRETGRRFSGKSDYAKYPSCRLMPINPEADPLEQTQEQEQTA